MKMQWRVLPRCCCCFFLQKSSHEQLENCGVFFHNIAIIVLPKPFDVKVIELDKIIFKYVHEFYVQLSRFGCTDFTNAGCFKNTRRLQNELILPFCYWPKAILSPAPWIQTVNFEATLFSQCKLVLNFQRGKQIKRKLDYKIIQIVWEVQTTAVRKTSWFWNISFCVKKRNMNIQVTDWLWKIILNLDDIKIIYSIHNPLRKPCLTGLTMLSL